MEEPSDIERKIIEIETELVNLDNHRDQLLDELTQLRRQFLQIDSLTQLPLHIQEIAINNQSPQVEKIKLFRSLFRGREDVFPRRFENSRTGKSSYAPVCKNEWQS
ncbi:restriction endonuclease subunit R, partial [bacterium]|nr:restriction endonuclease subunit R [bacterium]